MMDFNDTLLLLQSSIVQAVVFTVLFIFVLRFVISSYLEIRSSQYEVETSKIRLDSLRSSKEAKIYDLVNEMSSTNERWEDLNHLALDSAEPIERIGNRYKTGNNVEVADPHVFFERMGLNLTQLEIKPKSVFYLTPFHEEFDSTYKTVRDAADAIGLELSRGDEVFASGPISKLIIQRIAEANLIVANLDGRNPNVFYELGFANALGKPVLMIAHRNTSVPFDVSADRILIWADQNELRTRFKEALALLAISNS